MGLTDVAQPARLQELGRVFANVEDDTGAAQFGVALGDREAAFSVRAPRPGLRLSGLAARDLDRVGDHEGRIEADAALADERPVLARVATEVFQRSEERRVGRECVWTGRVRWGQDHENKKNTT